MSSDLESMSSKGEYMSSDLESMSSKGKYMSSDTKNMSSKKQCMSSNFDYKKDIVQNIKIHNVNHEVFC